jgi:tetratricopeptide (TPR) repeat protein
MKILALCTVKDDISFQTFVSSYSRLFDACWFLSNIPFVETFSYKMSSSVSLEEIQSYASSLGWNIDESYVLHMDTNMDIIYTPPLILSDLAYRVKEQVGPYDSYPIRLASMLHDITEFEGKDIPRLDEILLKHSNTSLDTYTSYIQSGEYQKAIECDPKRAEAYYRLGLYHKERSDMPTALSFFMKAKECSYPTHAHTNIERDVYAFKIVEELSICGYYVPEYRQIGSNACEELVLSRKIPSSLSSQSYKNQYFYIDKMNFFYKTVMTMYENEMFKCSSSSLMHVGNNRFKGIQRLVNYSIRPENGSYIIRHPANHLVTQNVLYEKEGDEIRMLGILTTNVPKRRNSHIQGLEDMRIFMFKEQTYAFGTTFEWGIHNHPSQVLCKLEGTVITKIVPLLYKEQYMQKNWCPFVWNDTICCIYSYHPLRILQVDEKTGKCDVLIEKICDVNLERVRGSTSPIWNGKEYVVVTHEIHEKGLRHYMHRIVWFDSEWNWIRSSKPFYLEKKQIEYILGFAPYEQVGKYLIHYSTMDNTSNLISIDI